MGLNVSSNACSFACNISSGASQSLISCDDEFILQNANVDKCAMITRVDGFEMPLFSLFMSVPTNQRGY